MKYPSVFRQLHATRCPVQKPDTDIFFQLPDRHRGPSLLNAQAIGCVGEAPHFRYRYENEDIAVSREDPKILRVDDTEIVSDGRRELVEPARHGFAQESKQ